MLVRERGGCSPVLQKPSCVLLTVLTVRYTQCQRDSLCSEYRWAFFSCDGGGNEVLLCALYYV